MHEMSIDKVVMTWRDGPARGGMVVILKEQGGDRSVPIFIGPGEGHALLLALQGLGQQRPMTHDLLHTVIREMGGRIEGVLVSAIKETTYYATLRIAIGEKTLEVDCRPSDGMVLASRSSSLLQVDESVLEAASAWDIAKVSPFSVLWPVSD